MPASIREQYEAYRKTVCEYCKKGIWTDHKATRACAALIFEVWCAERIERLESALREAQAQRDEQGLLKAQATANAEGTWRAFVEEHSKVKRLESVLQSLVEEVFKLNRIATEACGVTK